MTSLKDLGGEQLLIVVTIDRSKLTPCLILAKFKDNEDPWPSSKRYFFEYGRKDEYEFGAFEKTLGLKGRSSLLISRIIKLLVQTFHEKEASMLELRLCQDKTRNWVISKAHFEFDDAAFKIAERQKDIHSMRALRAEDPEELKAEKDCIVYVKYSNISYPIHSLLS